MPVTFGSKACIGAACKQAIVNHNRGDQQQMDVNQIVQLEKDFLLERIDGEISLYHPVKTTAVYLNETGALIWELCDDQKTVADIIGILSEHYPESREQIRQDVQDVIGKLVEKNIARLI